MLTQTRVALPLPRRNDAKLSERHLRKWPLGPKQAPLQDEWLEPIPWQRLHPDISFVTESLSRCWRSFVLLPGGFAPLMNEKWALCRRCANRGMGSDHLRFLVSPRWCFNNRFTHGSTVQEAASLPFKKKQAFWSAAAFRMMWFSLARRQREALKKFLQGYK